MWLEEDEVLVLKIVGNENFVLNDDWLEDNLGCLPDDWWDHNLCIQLGEREIDEDNAACKELDSPKLKNEYDKEKMVLTVRAKFSVCYTVSGWLDSDYAEEYYNTGSGPNYYDDVDCGTPREWWEDDYGSEDAFWACNGI